MALFHGTVRSVNCRDYSPLQVETWAPDVIDAERAARWATLANSHAFVAEEAGQVVGFADVESDGHVDRFYVHKDRQGRGVGTLLMHAIEAEARSLGVKRLYSEVSITARPFFEKRGFCVIAPQRIVARGVEFLNFRMDKLLDAPGCAPGISAQV